MSIELQNENQNLKAEVARLKAITGPACSKLFLVRLENGNSVYLQAKDEQDAAAVLGLTADPADYVDILECDTVEQARKVLVDSGSGKQAYIIKEVSKFFCTVDLKDGGTFSLDLDGEEANKELWDFYPFVSAAEDRIDQDAGGDITKARLDNPHVIAVMKQAVLAERERLASPTKIVN